MQLYFSSVFIMCLTIKKVKTFPRWPVVVKLEFFQSCPQRGKFGRDKINLFVGLIESFVNSPDYAK